MKRLEKDMKVDHIRLLMTFKQDYPFSPPFVRVVYPRFKQSTGYIIDGAFCMELLTNQARKVVSQVRQAVSCYIPPLECLSVYPNSSLTFELSHEDDIHAFTKKLYCVLSTLRVVAKCLG